MPTVRRPRECRTPRAVPAMPPGGSNRELPTNVNRVDPSGRIDRAVTEDQVPDPNGLTFSPDYKRLEATRATCMFFDVGADNRISNQKLFTDCMVDGVKCSPDGNAGRHVGYSGVTVRQPVLRRAHADPPVHGRQPVALCGLR